MAQLPSHIARPQLLAGTPSSDRCCSCGVGPGRELQRARAGPRGFEVRGISSEWLVTRHMGPQILSEMPGSVCGLLRHSVNTVPRGASSFLGKGISRKSSEHINSRTIDTKVTIRGMEKCILKNDTPNRVVVQKGGFTLLLLFQFWPQKGCIAVPSTVSQQRVGASTGGQTSRPWHRWEDTEDPPRPVLGYTQKSPDTTERPECVTVEHHLSNRLVIPYLWEEQLDVI